jgi:hypothetical protein
MMLLKYLVWHSALAGSFTHSRIWLQILALVPFVRYDYFFKIIEFSIRTGYIKMEKVGYFSSLRTSHKRPYETGMASISVAFLVRKNVFTEVAAYLEVGSITI